MLSELRGSAFHRPFSCLFLPPSLFSSMPPVRYQIWCATVGARWSSLTITRMPLESWNSVVPAWGWPTAEAVRAPEGGPCGVGAVVWAIAAPLNPANPPNPGNPDRPEKAKAATSVGRTRRERRAVDSDRIRAAPAPDKTAQWFMRPRLLEFWRLILPGY